MLWPLADHLRTIRDIGDLDEGTNSFGIANHRVYDSFGNLISQTNSSASIDFAYTGKFFDPDTGLSYHWNRWFDPGLGKWLTPDPIGFAAGDANLYRYVGNHPTGAIDPSGLDWLFPNEVGETGEVISAPVDGDANAGFFDPVTKFLNPGISQQYFDLAVASASSSTGTRTVFTAPPSQQPQYPQLSARPLTYRDMAIDDTLTPAEQEAYYEAIELEAWRRRDTTGWYGSRAMQIQYFEDRIAIAARIRRYHDMSVAERMFRPDSIFDLNTAIMIVGVGRGAPRIPGLVGTYPTRMKTVTINWQKQAGHIRGTSQHQNRVNSNKPTSTFWGPESAEHLTIITFLRGRPVPNRPNVKELDFGVSVGTGPLGGVQTRVRVHVSPKTGEIHGHPSGPEKK